MNSKKSFFIKIEKKSVFFRGFIENAYYAYYTYYIFKPESPETLIKSGKNKCSRYFDVPTTPYYNLLQPTTPYYISEKYFFRGRKRI